jgi:purine-nucleoside phosphorylase
MQQHVVQKEVDLNTVVFDKISAAESAANERIQEEQKQLEQAADEEHIRQQQRIKAAREAVEKESNLQLSKEQRHCEGLLQKNGTEVEKEMERWKIEARNRKSEAVKSLIEQFLSLRDI